MGAVKEAALEAEFERRAAAQVCLQCGESSWVDEPYDEETDSGGICGGCLYLNHAMSKDD
jgi:hypothetical protein